MQSNIHSPDACKNHCSIDVVATFVIGISFLVSEFWRTAASLIAGPMSVMACLCMNQSIQRFEHRTVAEIGVGKA